MRVEDLAVEDYHDLVNALVEGPSVEAVCSFRIEWSASSDKHQFRHVPGSWESNVVFNTAKVAWTAASESARFVSDAASTSTSLFAQVGHERNGVFFS